MKRRRTRAEHGSGKKRQVFCYSLHQVVHTFSPFFPSLRIRMLCSVFSRSQVTAAIATARSQMLARNVRPTEIVNFTKFNFRAQASANSSNSPKCVRQQAFGEAKSGRRICGRKELLFPSLADERKYITQSSYQLCLFLC